MRKINFSINYVTKFFHSDEKNKTLHRVFQFCNIFVFCIILESWLSGQFKKLMIYKHILQIMTEKWLWIWFLSVYFLQSDLHHKKLCRQVIFDNLLHCNTILECWEHVDSYTFSEMLWTFVFDKEIEKNTCPKKVAIPCKSTSLPPPQAYDTKIISFYDIWFKSFHPRNSKYV